ncbi:AMP-binding protein [Pseudonocardia sp. GCM10023141]|uniref:AMP-binding protein n=1 Tax=Pseudonocardia sp. GCM10023141 TaxID=3252653 RepID=UPI003610023F
MMRPGPGLATVPRLLADLADRAPGTVALVAAETGASLTAAEFVDTNYAWARRFAAAGIGADDTVATMLGPSFAAYHAWLGLAALGAVEVPINPQLRGRTLAHLLGHSRASLAVVERQYLDAVAEVADGIDRLSTVVVLDAEPPPGPWPFRLVGAAAFAHDELPITTRVGERHDTACVIYTSGTTGPPKGVIIPWGWMNQPPGHLPARIDPGGSRYSFLSPAHMSGKGALGQALVERRPLVLRASFSVRAFWEDIRTYDCRVSQLFPPSIKYLLAAAPRPDDRDGPLQHIWTAPVIHETTEFMQRFDVSVTTGFGSTEIGGAIARVDIDGTDLACCGRQAVDPRGYELRVVDEHDREVAPDEVGELLVRTSEPWTLTPGYFHDGDATAAAWRNGWFHTGDAMRRNANGDFYFIDRYKDCIRRKGENISSFEVEAYVMDHPSVVEAAAVGVAADDGEQEIKVLVVVREPVELGVLGDWLATRMPAFMTPRYLETVPSLPRTPATGRVQKSTLRSRSAGPTLWDRLSQPSRAAQPAATSGAPTVRSPRVSRPGGAP